MTNLITSRSSGKAAITFEARARDKGGFGTGEIRDNASNLAVLQVWSSCFALLGVLLPNRWFIYRLVHIVSISPLT